MQRDTQRKLSPTTNAELLARRQAAVARGVGHTHLIFAARADNAEVWDVEGKRYIDFAGGIAVLNTGHRHPQVIAAVKAQLELYTHTCFQVLAYEPYVALAEQLNALAPGDFAKKTLLLSSGAEALENAVKIARAHTGRPGIIAFTGGYHGRTMFTLGLTGKVAPYKLGFGPFPGSVFHALFPNALHSVSVDAAHRLGRKHLQERHRGHAGGGHHHRAGAGRRRLLRGAGRLHAAAAQAVRPARHPARSPTRCRPAPADAAPSSPCEQMGVAADIVTMAKSLAGGFPISAVVGRAEVMDAPAPGGLGGTYAGIAAGLRCGTGGAGGVREGQAAGAQPRRRRPADGRLQGAWPHSTRRSATCAAWARWWRSSCSRTATCTSPMPTWPRRIVAEAAKRGLILLSCGMYGNVIRILVPLTASDACSTKAWRSSVIRSTRCAERPVERKRHPPWPRPEPALNGTTRCCSTSS